MFGVEVSPLLVGTLLVLAFGASLVIVSARRQPRMRLDHEAAAQAAVELQRIRQQLEVDRARAEICRDAETLKQEIEDELR